jgi:hypothetical protein
VSDNVTGWVRRNQGLLIYNDRADYRNLGNYGQASQDRGATHTQNGVAYSFGGKQTPGQWINSLNSNPHALPDNIIHYNEMQQYIGQQLGCRFGGTNPEWVWNEERLREAGVDCSGFIQNCYSYACFPNGVRIVPNEKIPMLEHTPNAVNNVKWLNVLRAGDGNNNFRQKSRIIPGYPKNNEQEHWARGGDLVITDRHIAMIAEDVPGMLGGGLDFMIMHAFGTARNNQNAFTRKTIRSPLRWWAPRQTQSYFTFAKVYIW